MWWSFDSIFHYLCALDSSSSYASPTFPFRRQPSWATNSKGFQSSESSLSPHCLGQLDYSYEPDVDIKTFLLSRFEEIKENHQLAAYIPQTWPAEELIDRLVRKASAQFIYASTVMKYLDSPKHRLMKRLDVIIGLRPVDGDIPYKELDALYAHIFSCVEDFSIIVKILGFFFFHSIAVLQPLTPNFLADLAGLYHEDIYLSLSELHAIIRVPPLYIYPTRRRQQLSEWLTLPWNIFLSTNDDLENIILTKSSSIQV